jgi:hypothetical protein
MEFAVSIDGLPLANHEFRERAFGVVNMSKGSEESLGDNAETLVVGSLNH